MTRLQSVTERTSGSMKRFTSSFAGLAGAIGATAALAGSMMLVKNSIGSAFDRIDTMERFERTMTTMLGTSEKAKAALKGLSAVVDGTAYGLDTAARSVQNFVSRGIEVKKATKWFEAMGDAVAFYGDGSNEQLEGVSSAMSKMLSSGKVSMQQMETLYIAGIDGPGIYAKAVGKSTTEVQKALSSGKVSAEEFFDVVTTAMMEGTNGTQKIAGTAKQAGATWAGAIANMKFAVVRGVTAIITSLDEMLANNGLPSLRDMVTAFGKKFESVLKGAAAAIQPFIDKVKSIYETLKPYASIFKEIAIAVGIFVGAMFGVSATLGVISAVAGALAFLSGPVGLVVLAITGLALTIRAFYKYSEPFRGAVDGIVGAVKGLFQMFAGNSADAFKTFLEAGLSMEQIGKLQRFKVAFSKTIDDVKEAFDRLRQMKPYQIATLIGFSPDAISGITKNVESLKKAFSGVGDGVKQIADAAQPAVESLMGMFGSIGDTFMSFIEGIQPGIATLIDRFSSFGATLVDVFVSLWGLLGPIFSGIATAFGIIGDAATIVFTNVVVPAIDLVIWAFQTLWNVAGPLLELLGAAIELAFTMLKIMWDTVISPFVGFLTGEFASAVEKTTGTVDSIGAAFEFVGGIISTVAGYVKDFAGALANVKIPDWIGSIGGKLKGAAGAVNSFLGIGGPAKSHYHGLDRVPYDGYMARLHKGETVLTRQEADAYAGIDYKSSYGNSYDNRSYDYTTVNQTESSGGKGGIYIAKLADEIVVREEADVDRIANEMVKKIIAATGAGA